MSTTEDLGDDLKIAKNRRPPAERPWHLAHQCALGVTIGAGILAHDVLDGFDDVGDVGHGVIRVEIRSRRSSGLRCLIQ